MVKNVILRDQDAAKLMSIAKKIREALNDFMVSKHASLVIRLKLKAE